MAAVASLAVIVPVRGKHDVLTTAITSLEKSVRNCPQATLVLVDNNEPDVHDPALYAFADSADIVKSRATTVGGVRNDGARLYASEVSYLVFVDSDCIVRESFCSDVITAFDSSKAAVVGCRVVSPRMGHWTEIASDELHRKGGDGPRQFLNSGCLAVHSSAFVKVGGFSEVLPANEDYDFCARIRLTGAVIWQLEALQVIHMGNPKSLAGFFKRLMWHGTGAVREDGRLDLSPMLIATLANSASVLMGSTALLFFHSAPPALLVFAMSLIAVPVAFWILRIIQLKRWIRPDRAIALMQITFLARQIGLIKRLREVYLGAR